MHPKLDRRTLDIVHSLIHLQLKNKCVCFELSLTEIKVLGNAIGCDETMERKCSGSRQKLTLGPRATLVENIVLILFCVKCGTH